MASSNNDDAAIRATDHDGTEVLVGGRVRYAARYFLFPEWRSVGRIHVCLIYHYAIQHKSPWQARQYAVLRWLICTARPFT